MVFPTINLHFWGDLPILSIADSPASHVWWHPRPMHIVAGKKSPWPHDTHLFRGGFLGPKSWGYPLNHRRLSRPWLSMERTIEWILGIHFFFNQAILLEDGASPHGKMVKVQHPLADPWNHPHVFDLSKWDPTLCSKCVESYKILQVQKKYMSNVSELII